MKELDRIAGEEVGLDIESGPAAPHRELKRPYLARIIDDAIDIYIPDKADRFERRLEGIEDDFRQLAASGISNDSAHFARIRADIASTKSLMLEVLLITLCEACRAKPGANGELDTLDPLLQ